MMMDLIVQLENAGVDSILDLGFSKKIHREKFKAFANEHDFQIQYHFLDVPKKVRWQRVLKRNEEKGDTYQFEVSKDNFEFMEEWFEAPDE